MNNILKSKPGGWRRYFTDRPALIEYCEQGFIRFESPEKILLFKHSQQNHTHVELYSYNLYLKELQGKTVADPFDSCFYYDVRSSDEHACIIFDDYVYKRINFQINLYWNSEEKKFVTEFFKSKGNKKLADYPQEIIKIAESSKLEWYEDYEKFYTFGRDEKETITILKNFLFLLKMS